MTKSLKFDISYMRMAMIWAENSHCVRKKVGALIVKDNMIISDGFNGMPAGADNCCENAIDGETKWEVIHSEANAITKLARTNNSCDGATLYITLSPCKDCSKLILASKIKRVVYGMQHSDTSGIDFLKKNGVIVEQLELKIDRSYEISNSSIDASSKFYPGSSSIAFGNHSLNTTGTGTSTNVQTTDNTNHKQK